MKQWVSDFKQFVMRGNVIDMAVGIVIGAAFGKVVSSFVADIVSPFVALFTGGYDFSNLKVILKHATMNGTQVVKPEVSLLYGDLIQVCLDFIITAFAIFWAIRVIARFNQKKKEEAAATPPPTPEDTVLLREIRDLMKKEK